MKKIFAVAALALVPFTASYADNNVGCGLGTQLMAGQDGIAFKVLAATTNGTLGNQTFGITTGTLGCNGSGKITVSAELNQFASANLDQLAAEMAAGAGDTLAALANIYKIDGADREAFYAFARSNYSSIFVSDAVTAEAVVVALTERMASDSRFSRYAV